MGEVRDDDDIMSVLSKKISMIGSRKSYAVKVLDDGILLE
jgi:hypothetical protein